MKTMTEFLIIIIAVMIAVIITTGCAVPVDISDSRHTVVHTIELSSTVDVIQQLCRSEYPDATESQIATCVQETIKALFDFINSSQQEPGL